MNCLRRDAPVSLLTGGHEAKRAPMLAQVGKGRTRRPDSQQASWSMYSLHWSSVVGAGPGKQEGPNTHGLI